MKGYEHLLDSIREHVPGARITLLGPSPYDDVTRPVMFPGGYNAVMQHFAEVDQSLARKYGAAFVESESRRWSPRFSKADAMDPQLAVAAAAGSRASRSAGALGDGRGAAEGMACAGAGFVGDHRCACRQRTEARNAAVSHLEQTDGALKWTEIEDALPLPLTRSNATAGAAAGPDRYRAASEPGAAARDRTRRRQYTLSIDGERGRHVFSPRVRSGINLADYGTPMFQQAQRVSWLVRDRDEAHYIHLRMRVRNADTGSEEGKDVMQAFENSLEDSIYEAATPKPHVFRADAGSGATATHAVARRWESRGPSRILSAQ